MTVMVGWNWDSRFSIKILIHVKWRLRITMKRRRWYVLSPIAIFSRSGISCVKDSMTRIISLFRKPLGWRRMSFSESRPDAYYARYFQWGVKKRYAYVDFNGKRGYRGVEMRRSSAPKIVKDAQQVIFDSILTIAIKTELNQIIRDIEVNMLGEGTWTWIWSANGNQEGRNSHTKRWHVFGLTRILELNLHLAINRCCSYQSTPNGLPPKWL